MEGMGGFVSWDRLERSPASPAAERFTAEGRLVSKRRPDSGHSKCIFLRRQRRAWIIGDFGSRQRLSVPLPATAAIATGDTSFPLPPMGVVGFFSALTTPTEGLRCEEFDFAKVNTGPGSAFGRPEIRIPGLFES